MMFNFFIEFIIDFISSSGRIFFPLFLVGLVSWYLVVSVYNRLYQMIKYPQINFLDDKMGKSVEEEIRKNNEEKENTNSKSFLLKRFEHCQKEQLWDGEELKEAYGDFLDQTIFKKFNRDIRTIAVLAGVAPLLGLLGTVTGMMNTFEVISLYGNSNPILMADGISEAMLTTQIGLLIAFPLLLMVAWLRHRLKSLHTQLMKEFIVFNDF